MFLLARGATFHIRWVFNKYDNYISLRPTLNGIRGSGLTGPATNVLLQCAEVLKVTLPRMERIREEKKQLGSGCSSLWPVCTYHTTPREGSRAHMVRRPCFQKDRSGDPLYHLPGTGSHLDPPLLQFCHCESGAFLRLMSQPCKSNS